MVSWHSFESELQLNPFHPMNLESILNIIQIASAVLMIGSILLQQREGGLSTVFGGGGAIAHTRRGVEQYIFNATIILAVIFFGVSFVLFLLG